MKNSIALTLLLPLFASLGCTKNEGQPTPPTSSPSGKEEDLPKRFQGATVSPPPKVIVADRKAAAYADSMFAINLFQKLHVADGNLVYSPVSISMGLQMAWAGAANETEKEMRQAMQIALPADMQHSVNHVRLYDWNGVDGLERAYQLSVANSLWGQFGEPFQKEFTDLLETRYATGFRRTDFVKAPEESRARINHWVEDWTRGKITELIPSDIFNPNTRLVLANAIYFKGTWASPFDKDNTNELPFQLASDQSVNVPMMHQKRHYRYGETDQAQLLELPYKGNTLSMVVLLPKKRGGLADLEKSLKPNDWSDLMRSMKMNEVLVYLPRFKFENSLQLQESLAGMGMPKAFSTMDADFSRMNGKKELFISHVLHKATIEVNEEGTEAAASTAVIGDAKSAAPDKVRQIPVFRADHPFLFAIRDGRVGEILFMGRVADPSK